VCGRKSCQRSRGTRGWNNDRRLSGVGIEVSDRGRKGNGTDTQKKRNGLETTASLTLVNLGVKRRTKTKGPDTETSKSVSKAKNGLWEEATDRKRAHTK